MTADNHTSGVLQDLRCGCVPNTQGCDYSVITPPLLSPPVQGLSNGQSTLLLASNIELESAMHSALIIGNNALAYLFCCFLTHLTFFFRLFKPLEDLAHRRYFPPAPAKVKSPSWRSTWWNLMDMELPCSFKIWDGLFDVQLKCLQRYLGELVLTFLLFYKTLLSVWMVAETSGPDLAPQEHWNTWK